MLTYFKGRNLWFFEDLYKNHTFGFEVRDVLVPEYHTGIQKLMVLDTPRFGRVLILDGIVQFAEFDEFVYHETMAHTAMFNHANPRKVLIVGGGDYGIAREVLKHSSVELVYVVDIDPEVTRIAEQYFPTLTKGARGDERLVFMHRDATQIDVLFKKNYFDVALLDTTDNVNAAVPLFKGIFTRKVHDALTESGIMIRLAGSLFFQKSEVVRVKQDTELVFGKDKTEIVPFTGAAAYYGGPFALVMARKGNGKASFLEICNRYEHSGIQTKLYSPGTHWGNVPLTKCSM